MTVRSGGVEEKETARGLRAASPLEMPWRGWRDVLKRTVLSVGRRRLGLAAAGIAFYALLAVFPAIAFVIALWGLFADPDAIVAQFDTASVVLPADAATIIEKQAVEVAEDGGALSIALLAGVFIALFSASRCAKAIMHALNIVYDEVERRNILSFNLIGAAITAGVVAWMLIAVGVVIVAPMVVRATGLGAASEVLISFIRWAVLLAGAWLAISAVFRYAPCRRRARWEWITPGAALAVALWLAASALFSIYVSNFANYNETYGALGAVIILLMWFWVSAFVILFGASLDAELERQTEADTTVGPSKRIGARGAHVADYPSPARGPASIFEGPPPDPRS